MSGKLYLTATPIGNLGDISERCEQTLREVDFIAAEDTRVTVKLLNHLGIKKPMISYFEHNRYESGEKIIKRLLDGESCALVTDAGMPVISDPGEDIAARCAQAGIEVTVVPGPCALVSALAVSGLPSGRFTFEGFLSTAKKTRREHLESLKDERRTMIFYEAPHKLKATLEDLAGCFGDERRVVICRELTKLHEETLRMSLREAKEHFEQIPPRGEFVIVVEGRQEGKEREYTFEQACSFAEEQMKAGFSKKDAARKAADKTGYSKNDLYSALLEMEKEKGEKEK